MLWHHKAKLYSLGWSPNEYSRALRRHSMHCLASFWRRTNIKISRDLGTLRGHNGSGSCDLAACLVSTSWHTYGRYGIAGGVQEIYSRNISDKCKAFSVRKVVVPPQWVLLSSIIIALVIASWLFDIQATHEFHENCHSITFYFMKKDSKRCCDTITPESIHTKDESKCDFAFAFIFGVNWPVQWM